MSESFDHFSQIIRKYSLLFLFSLEFFFTDLDTRGLEYRALPWHGTHQSLGCSVLRGSDDVWQLCSLQPPGRHPGRGILQPGRGVNQPPYESMSKQNYSFQSFRKYFIWTFFYCT